MPDLESRIVDLELRFMTLQRFADELSEVVAEQGRAIDALVAANDELRARLSGASETGGGDEKPPHY